MTIIIEDNNNHKRKKAMRILRFREMKNIYCMCVFHEGVSPFNGSKVIHFSIKVY